MKTPLNLRARPGIPAGRFPLLSCALLALACQTGLLTAQGPENLLLVVNLASADSRHIAEYYSQKRGVPQRNLCEVNTAEQASIDRRRFSEEILAPLADCLSSRRLQDQILYIVTTKGLPLVIEGRLGPMGDLASVDSELALLYRYLIQNALPIYGRIENPYFSYSNDVAEWKAFNRQDYDIYLVTRLTGETLVDALFLIDRSAKSPVPGTFYFDLPSGRRNVAAAWIEEAAQSLGSLGFETAIDRLADPIKVVKPALGYVNWGASDPSLSESPPTVEWAPGGLAVAFDPDSAAGLGFAGQNQEAASLSKLLATKPTGAGGFVADPSADGYFRPQILFPAYVSGFNLAESYWMSIRYVGWRQVVVGDPLAAPFIEKTLHLREAPLSCGLDDRTHLPECFSHRKLRYFVDVRGAVEEAARATLLAEGLHSQGRDAEALAALDTALKLDPELLEAHRSKAVLLEAQGDDAGAFHHYQRTAQLGDRSQELYFKMAWLAFERLEDSKTAAQYIRPLFLSDRDSPETGMLAARVEEALGEKEKAKSILAEMVKRPDPPPEALEALARIYFSDDLDLKLAHDLAGKSLEEFEARGTNGIVRERVTALLEEIAARQTAAAVLEAQVDSPESTPDLSLPTIVHKTPTKYPEEARLRRLEGIVRLELLIDERGQLLRTTVLGGPPSLAKAAVKSVRSWTFRPRLVNGRPEVGLLPVSIKFEIKNAD